MKPATHECETRYDPLCELRHILDRYPRPVEMLTNLLNSRENTFSDGLLKNLLLSSKAIIGPA